MSSRGIPPGRSSWGGSVVQSTIVLSTPIGEGPPSRITSVAGSSTSPRSASTWAAVVGLTRPNGLADGAAMPRPERASSSCVSGWAGARSPTESRPPVTASSTRAARGSSRVSGPGQQVAASSSAAAGTSAAQLGELVGAADVHDERVIDRPALDGEDPGDRDGVVGVGAEAVHRLGRDRHQAAAGEALDRARDVAS